VAVSFTQGQCLRDRKWNLSNDVVVTDGQDKLQQGSKIETRPAAPEPSNRMQGAMDPGVLAVQLHVQERNESFALFILRPVATALLMVAIMLVGIVAYRQCRFRPCPRWTIDDSGDDVLPRRQS